MVPLPAEHREGTLLELDRSHGVTQPPQGKGEAEDSSARFLDLQGRFEAISSLLPPTSSERFARRHQQCCLVLDGHERRRNTATSLMSRSPIPAWRASATS